MDYNPLKWDANPSKSVHSSNITRVNGVCVYIYIYTYRVLGTQVCNWNIVHTLF